MRHLVFEPFALSPSTMLRRALSKGLSAHRAGFDTLSPNGVARPKLRFIANRVETGRTCFNTGGAGPRH
jgi:hypothetical protein